MATIRKVKTKLKGKGSILVFTLLIMMVIVVSALAISASSIVNLNSTNGSGKSAQSFQVADSAVEIVTKDALHNPNSSVQTLYPSCTGATAANISVAAVTGASVTLYSDAAAIIPLACSDPISKAVMIKSVGTYAGTTRAIETALAATGCSYNSVSSSDCNGKYCYDGYYGSGTDRQVQTLGKMNADHWCQSNGKGTFAASFLENITSCASGNNAYNWNGSNWLVAATNPTCGYIFEVECCQ